MELSTVLMLSAVIVGAAFIHGTVGVGFALIVAPIFSLTRPELIPVALLVIMLPLNFYVAARERHALDKPGLGWITLGRTAGTFIGAAILAVISARALNIFVGASTVAAALLSLAAPTFSPGRKTLATAGLVTGITETATGIGGPPLALAYQHHPGPALRSTIAACFLIGELISLVLLALGGKVTGALLRDSVMLLPAVFIGAGLSRLVHHRVGGKGLRAGVMVFAIVSGLFLLIKEFI